MALCNSTMPVSSVSFTTYSILKAEAPKKVNPVKFSSVTQLCPTLCDPMDCRLPCLSPTPRACSYSCPLSQWYHPTISSSVVPFSSCLQSFVASGSFPVSQFFTTGGQSIRVSASASVLPMNIQDWFPVRLTGLISLQSRNSQESSPTTQFKSINMLHSAFFIVQISHPYMTTGKSITLTRWTFVRKVMSLLFNMLSRLVIAFLPRISWLQSPSTVILEPKKSLSQFPLFPHLFAMKWWDWMSWSSFFECWVLS